MIDIHLVRTDTDSVKQRLKTKGVSSDVIDQLLDMDKRRRELQSNADTMKKLRNERSKEIGVMIKKGEDAASLKEETRDLSDKIKSIDEDLKSLEVGVINLLVEVSEVGRIDSVKNSTQNPVYPGCQPGRKVLCPSIGEADSGAGKRGTEGTA